MVACHPARSCRRETERSTSWHCAQSFWVSALPGPSGSCAHAPAATNEKTAAALTKALWRRLSVQFHLLSRGRDSAFVGGRAILPAAAFPGGFSVRRRLFAPRKS